MDYIKQDAEMKRIYDKAMIKKTAQEKDIETQLREKVEKNFWEYLDDRMRILLRNIMKLYENPSASKKDIDDAQRGFSNLVDIVNTYTLPEVIEHLVLEESRKKYREKLK